MTSHAEDASQSNELPRVKPSCRDINTTSQMWPDCSYCTPESAALSRCAVSRRLHYATVTSTAPFLLYDERAAISTEPTPRHDNSASDDLHGVTLTPLEVTGGREDVTRPLPFNDEQIDCICDVLRQSKESEGLVRFISCLTQDQLQRDSEQLYKVL